MLQLLQGRNTIIEAKTQFRLAESTESDSHITGRLEANLAPDVWGPVCMVNANCRDLLGEAKVACHHMGYSHAKGYDIVNYDQSTGPKIVRMYCSGEETSLAGCSVTTLSSRWALCGEVLQITCKKGKNMEKQNTQNKTKHKKKKKIISMLECASTTPTTHPMLQVEVPGVREG